MDSEDSVAPWEDKVDPLLVSAVESIADRMRRGEEVDIEEIARQFPGQTEYVRELVETLHQLSQLQRDDSILDEESGDSTVSGPTQLRRIGEYEVLRRIAAGGMGIVFEARQSSLDRRVALKVLRLISGLDERQLQRFENEARAAATLHHPNIVPVFDFGEDRGIHYYAMQYIDGPSLAEVISFMRSCCQDCKEATPIADTGKLETRNLSDSTKSRLQSAAAVRSARDPDSYISMVIRWGIQAAEAIGHAHEHGVLHRDIKPGNLLLDCEGDVWVADFGLARHSGSVTVTIPGDIIGTIRYMSPEQAIGHGKFVDHRSDVYSLGVSLYEMLSLQPAFDGDDRNELLHQISSLEPVRLTSINPWMPQELQSIVGKAIAKDPADRYQSAEELANDLKRYLSQEPIQARPPTIFNRSVRWIQRNRTVTVAAFVVFLTLGVAAIASVWSSVRVTRAAMVTERLLYHADLRLASDAIERMGTKEAISLLQPHVRNAEQSGQVDFALHLLWDRAHPAELTYSGHGTSVNAVSAAAGSLVATSDSDGNIHQWNWSTGETLACYKTGVSQRCLLFSSTGEYLFAGGEDGMVRRIDLASHEVITSPGRHSDPIRALVFDPSGKQVLSADIFGSVISWNTQDLELIDSWDAAAGETLYAIAAASSGPQVVSTRYDKVSVEARQLSSGVVTGRVVLENSIRCAEISPVSRHVVIGTSTGQLVGMSQDSSQSLFVSQPSMQRIYKLSYSSDGRQVAVASKDGNVYVVDASTGDVLQILTGHSGRVYSVTFVDHDQRLVTVSSDGTSKVFRLAVNDGKRQRREETMNGSDVVVVGSRGHWTGPQDELVLQNATGSTRFSRRHTYATAAEFSPDRRWLVTYGSLMIKSQTPGVVTGARRVDVDLDGDLDWIAGLGPNFWHVWQENQGMDSTNGVVRSLPGEESLGTAVLCCGGEFQGCVAKRDVSHGEVHLFARENVPQRVSLEPDASAVYLIDDLDNDGRCEFLFENEASKKFRLAKMNREGEARLLDLPIEFTSNASFATIDVDYDQRKDVVVVDSESGVISCYRQLEGLAFDGASQITGGLESPGEVCVVDFDQDGRSDLLASDQEQLVWLRHRQDGSFDAPQPLRARLTDLKPIYQSPNVGVWDVEQGQLKTEFNCLTFRAYAAAISGRFRRVATCGQNREVQLFRLDDGAHVARLPVGGDRVNSLSFSPCDELLAIANGDDVVLWDFCFSHSVTRLEGHESTVVDLVFSPDGNSLLSVSDDRTAKLWDLKEAELLSTLFELDGSPISACFMDDGETIALGTDSGEISLWKASRGRRLLTVAHLEGKIECLSYDDFALHAIVRENPRSFYHVVVAPPKSLSINESVSR